MNVINLICLLLASIGAFFVYHSKKRKFTRTNWLGIEQFSSYGQKVVAGLTDDLIMAIGYACLGASPVILLVEYASEYLMLGVVIAIALWVDKEWSERRKR